MRSESQLCTPGTEDWTRQPRLGVQPPNCYAKGTPSSCFPAVDTPSSWGAQPFPATFVVCALHKGAAREARGLESSSLCPHAELPMGAAPLPWQNKLPFLTHSGMPHGPQWQSPWISRSPQIIYFSQVAASALVFRALMVL